MARERRAIWAAVAIAAALVVAVGGVVNASHCSTCVFTPNSGNASVSSSSPSYGCGGTNGQDNSTMSYFRSSLTTTMWTAVAHGINNNVAPTDVTVEAESSSAGTSTDVVFFDSDFPDGLCFAGQDWHPDNSDSGTAFIAAATGCRSLAGDNSCDRFDVKFDLSWLNLQTATRLDNVACHELGHTLGFGHPASTLGCIGSDTLLDYSSGEKTHINSEF